MKLALEIPLNRRLKMRIAFLALVFLVSGPALLFADCTKEEVCGLMETMDHFSILDKCPNAAPLLAECKKSSDVVVEDLPEPKFADNGDGTITDTVNKLMWIKKGILQKVSLKEAKEFAQTANVANKTDWRIPTLQELKTLVNHERVANASGQKAWINPMFDDDIGHYYWTTTTCKELTVIEDRYQKKTCQQGDQAAWLVHFNINAVFWHHVTTKNYHIWLVRNVK